MKQLSFKDKITARLKKLGLTERKAKELAVGLQSTARPTKTKISVTEKLTHKLVNLGLSERKAKELAKGLAPTVRAALKAKQQKASLSMKDADEAVSKAVDEAEDAELDKVAPRVNGHRLRLDMPIVPYTGGSGVELLQVLNGLTSSKTYLAAAVKSSEGIVAVRQFSEDSYKLKFYPNFAFWNFNQSQLESLGGSAYLNRGPYERMFFSRKDMDQVLLRIEAEAKPKSRIKNLLQRMASIKTDTLVKAFTILHSRVRSGVAASV